MPVIVLSFIAAILVIYFLFDTNRKRLKGLPPGPPTFPIVGSLPFLYGEGLASKLCDKSLEKYGDDFCTIWLGSKLFIIIQNFELTRDLFNFNIRLSIS